MRFYIVCDFRENFDSILSRETYGEYYNDHPSKNNITEIISCIRELGYDCNYFGGIPELVHAVDKQMQFPDSLFLNFSDGMSQNYSRVQAPALLDILGVKYSGSGVFASVLMNNKFFCKKAIQDLGVLMSKSCIISAVTPFDEEQIAEWKFPLFIKPNCEGSSLGITEENVCNNISDIYLNIERLLTEYHELILEEYIAGIDITNYLIGNGDSYLVNEVITAELHSKSDYAIYGIEEKHRKMRKLYYNDEYLPKVIVQQMRNQSVDIAKTIGAEDICRIDYRYNPETRQYYFIEINSAPRFSSTSEIGFIAEKQGIAFKDMVQRYINVFMKRVAC